MELGKRLFTVNASMVLTVYYNMRLKGKLWNWCDYRILILILYIHVFVEVFCKIFE